MLDRIEGKPGILGGKPCVKGTRLSVEFVLELFASGGSREQIRERYPELTDDDLTQVLQYAAQSGHRDVDFVVEGRR